MALAPAGSGARGTLRFVAAFWIALLAAGAFLYCVVLGAQAAAAQLPRAWYLRVSSVVQIGALGLFLGVLCFQASVNTAAALSAPANQRTLDWLPTYWFMGLLSELSGSYAAEGHPVMAPLAHRAMVGLALAILAAGTAFLLSYFRTLRKIVEEPDLVSGWKGRAWLPRFGSGPQTALAQFTIRTPLRSRRHRVILAFYLGGGFAIVAVYLGGARAMMNLSWLGLLGGAKGPILAATGMLLCASWLGTRTVFSLPLNLRSNWLFHMTPALAAADRVRAIQRALLGLSLFPVCAISGALLLPSSPLQMAVEHLLVLALVGSLLADFSLRGFRKIPFACSYLPGKSKVHMVFWLGVIPVIVVIHHLGLLELRALAQPLSCWAMIFGLAAAAFAARRMTDAAASRGGPEIQFEETSPDETIGLCLER